MKKRVLLLSLILIGILLTSSATAILYRADDSSVFTNTLSGWSCVRDNLNSYWDSYDNDSIRGIMSNGVMNGTGNCSLFAIGYNVACCPYNKPSCWSDGKCYTGGEFCANYNTSQSCASANTGGNIVAQHSVVNGSFMCTRDSQIGPYTIQHTTYKLSTCYNYTECGCSWIGNNCIGNATAAIYCQNSSGFEWRETDGYCIWMTPSDQASLGCDASGVITYTSKASWNGNNASTSLAKASCVDLSRTYTCPETSKLPFFGFFNLLVSVIIIGVIYSFYKR